MHNHRSRLSISFILSLWIHLLTFLGLFLYGGAKFFEISNNAQTTEFEVSTETDEEEPVKGENATGDKKRENGKTSQSMKPSDFQKQFGIQKEWDELLKNLSETSNLSEKFPLVYDEINYQSGAKETYIFRKRHYEDLIVKEVFPTLQNVDKPFDQILNEAAQNLNKYNERNEIIKKYRKWTKGEISENIPVVNISRETGKHGQTILQFPKEDREKYFNSTLKETKETQLYNFIARYFNFDPDKGDLPIAVRELYFDNLQRIVYPFSGDPTYLYIDYFDENLNKEDFLRNSLYQAARLKNSKTQTELLFALHDIYEIQQRAWQHFFDFENQYKNLSLEKKKNLRIETLRRIHERYKPLLTNKHIKNYPDAIKVYAKKREEILYYIMAHTPQNYRKFDAEFERGRLHWDLGMQLNNDKEKKTALDIWRNLGDQSKSQDKDFLNKESTGKLQPLIKSYDRFQNFSLIEGPIQSVIQQRQSKRLQEKVKREEKILWPR